MKKKKLSLIFINKNLRFIIILIIVIVFHILMINFIRINKKEKEVRKGNKIYYMVNIKEFIPKEIVQIEKQDKIAEEIIEAEVEIVEIDADYLLPMKGADLPIFPEKWIKSRLHYPKYACENGIEARVELELFIDKHGIIKKIVVIKDPGYGFAEAAVKAFTSVRCIPAKNQGIPYAIRLRKIVRFSLSNE